MKGLKLRTVIGLFCLVLTLAGVLVAHVWKQNAYVRLSMASVKLADQEAKFRNGIALLEVSVGGLKKLSRMEAMAKSRALEYGKAPVLVYLDGDARGGAPAEAPAVAQAAAGEKQFETGAMGDFGKGLQSGKAEWRTSGL